MKIAVVGTGYIAARRHIPAWKRLTGKAELVALCDADAARAEECAGRFEVPSFYSDLGQLLERERPDLVDICTPPRSHLGVALQAMDGGAHVLVEKPMGVTVDVGAKARIVD